MIQDSDEKVIFEVSRTHMRREVARLIYDFFTGAGAINSFDRRYSTENRMCEVMMTFSIKGVNHRRTTEYLKDSMLGYPMYVSVPVVNEYLESGLKWIGDHLPEKLHIKYSYTTFEIEDETRLRGLRETRVIRSGYDVEIMDPEKIDHEFWDGAYASSHDFHIKFKILGERLEIKPDRYEDSLQARFSELDYNEDASAVVEEISQMIITANRLHQTFVL